MCIDADFFLLICPGKFSVHPLIVQDSSDLQNPKAKNNQKQPDLPQRTDLPEQHFYSPAPAREPIIRHTARESMCICPGQFINPACFAVNIIPGQIVSFHVAGRNNIRTKRFCGCCDIIPHFLQQCNVYFHANPENFFDFFQIRD